MSEDARQLNIRDTEIYERAHELARSLGVSAKEAVRRALEAFEPPQASSKDDPERRRRLAELRAMRGRLREHAAPRTHEEDDALLYDEHGLPR